MRLLAAGYGCSILCPPSRILSVLWCSLPMVSLGTNYDLLLTLMATPLVAKGALLAPVKSWPRSLAGLAWVGRGLVLLQVKVPPLLVLAMASPLLFLLTLSPTRIGMWECLWWQSLCSTGRAPPASLVLVLSCILNTASLTPLLRHLEAKLEWSKVPPSRLWLQVWFLWFVR